MWPDAVSCRQRVERQPAAERQRAGDDVVAEPVGDGDRGGGGRAGHGAL
jgi:hypothetical protein